MKEEFGSLIDRLKAERDRIKLQAHLATMEAREEIEAAEEKWNQLKGFLKIKCSSQQQI